jgi:hypothetical protein
MFSNWFADKSDPPDTRANVPPIQTSGLNVNANNNRKTDSSPSTARQHTGIFTSPHDVIVEDLVGRLYELKAAASGDDESDGVGGRPPSDERTHMNDELPKNIYDPYDGQSIGLLLPRNDARSSETSLWTHLAQVRDLQSEIARMHAQMEGLGDSERGVGSPEQATGEEPLNMEEEAKAVQTAEFSKLSERFNERKKAIEAIMLKVRILRTNVSRKAV